MKFLVDAHLPARLARLLADAGHDAVHTTELPDGNRTTDSEIATISDREQRVVITKDRDFRDTHLLAGTPRRLLIVATGNITNTALLTLFAANLPAIIDGIDDSGLVELRSDTLIVHRRRGSTSDS